MVFSLWCGTFFVPFYANANILDSMLGTNVFASSSNAPVAENSQNMTLLQANVSSVPNSTVNTNVNIVSDNALVPAVTPASSQFEGVEDGSTLSDQMSFYVVGQGDSIPKIAEMFEISEKTILSANGMKKGDSVKEGDVLMILPTDGVVETVTKGVTLQGLAQKYKVDKADIAWYNDLSTDAELTIGQELIIPGAEVSNPAGSKTKPSTDSKKYPNVNLKSVPGYFAYPVKIGGAVRKTQGLHAHRRAVDFGAPVGTPVYAAADGIVILAKGNNGYNGGFGNYIMLSHSNGAKTLYAHLSSVMVSIGSSVSQGQVIGLSGGKKGAPGAGRTTGPHLHFETINVAQPF